MAVLNYNVETRLRKYTVSTPADKCFEEKLIGKDAPRTAWAEMMLYAQKEKILNRTRLEPQPTIIKVSSLAALQCKNEAHFQHLVSEILRHNASLYSLKEEAFFSNDCPEGISNKPEEFAKIKAMWQKKPAAPRKTQHVISI